MRCPKCFIYKKKNEKDEYPQMVLKDGKHICPECGYSLIDK